MIDRTQGIGASEAAAALGLSPYKSALSIYLEKIGEAPPFEGNIATRMGTLLEPLVLAECESRVGTITRRQERVPFAERPWLWATLDGVAEQVPAVIEAKTAGRDNNFGADGSDQVPQEYVAQVQVQMACAGYALAIVPVLFTGSREYRQFEVKADDELFRMMLSGLDDFWGRVQRRDPPDPATYQDIALRYPRSVGTIVQASPEIIAAHTEFLVLREQRKTIEGREQDLTGVLKMAMGESDTLLDGESVLVTWRNDRDSLRFNVDAFKAAHTDLFQKFQVMRPGSRKFLVKVRT